MSDVTLIYSSSTILRNFKVNIMRIIKHKLHTEAGTQILYKLINEELQIVIGKAAVSRFNGEVRLHTIYIKPEYRGMGYGERLIRKIIEDGGDTPISLCTHLGNISFFAKYDFEITKNEDDSSLVEMVRRTF